MNLRSTVSDAIFAALCISALSVIIHVIKLAIIVMFFCCQWVIDFINLNYKNGYFAELLTALKRNWRVEKNRA